MNPSDVIAEEEYEESLYDQMSALKKNNDASKLLSGRGISGFQSLSSSIVQSPDQVKSNTNMVRREPLALQPRKLIARQKTLSIDEKPEHILIQHNPHPKPQITKAATREISKESKVVIWEIPKEPKPARREISRVLNKVPSSSKSISMIGKQLENKPRLAFDQPRKTVPRPPPRPKLDAILKKSAKHK